MAGLARTVAVALAFGAALAPATASAQSCGHAADVDPAAQGASLRAARHATLCLLNVQRRRHHERRLRFNHQLAVAGVRHARDMVANDYFAHSAPSGQTFVDRILNTNYVPAGTHWTVAENLAWGSEAQSTPRWIVNKWMHSPEHRRNILDGRLRDIGIAIVVGAPVEGAPAAATYDTEFGVVRRLH